jgi:hypothetical protein
VNSILTIHHVVVALDMLSTIRAECPRGVFGKRVATRLGRLTGSIHASHGVAADVVAEWIDMPLPTAIEYSSVSPPLLFDPF